MRRRRLLALLAGGAAGLSGCTADGPATSTATATQTPERNPETEPETPRTATPTTTASPTPTPAAGPTVLDAGEAFAADAGWTLAVEDPRARRGVIEFGTTHPDPLLPADRQFVVVDVAVTGDGPDPASPCLAARLDGTRPFDTCRRHHVFSERNGTDGDRTVQVTALPVPLDVGGADSLDVVWHRENGDEVVWRLPDGVLPALAAPPAFAVRSFEVPDRVEPETEFAVTVTVENAGGRDGTFVAEVGTTTLSDQPDFEVDVPAGETVETTRQVPAYFADGEDEMTVRLGWDRDETTKSVRRA